MKRIFYLVCAVLVFASCQNSIEVPAEYFFEIKYGLLNNFDVVTYSTIENKIYRESYMLTHSLPYSDSLVSKQEFHIDRTNADSIFILAYKSNQKLDILHENEVAYINDEFFQVSLSANSRKFINYYASDNESAKISELNKIKSILNKIMK